MDLTLIARSIRRSAVRSRVLIALARRKRAYPQQLAEDADIDTRDLRRAMRGELPYYTPVLSPIRLGLARLDGRGRRREYVITPIGEVVAREVKALRGRR